jgi:phosphoglycerate dehydrogenase-like enzyme
MKIILCGSTFPPSRAILAPLLPGDDVIVVERADLDGAVRSADVLIPMMTRLDAGLIGITSARLIQQWGAGLEGVDIEAASARGIFVCNVPSDATPNAESTAEHALLLMLATARRLPTCVRMFEEGTWGAPLGDALFGRRALIVGFGRIGRALARRLIAMGMQVDAIRRQPEPGEAERHGVDRIGRPAELTRLAGEADFVVCTATATRDARGMINTSVFRAMKPTAIVVNVSRGAVIEEADLVTALREGTIAGAGLDVFAEEPVRRDHPLLAMEQVSARMIAANVTAVKAAQPLRYCVNQSAVAR